MKNAILRVSRLLSGEKASIEHAEIYFHHEHENMNWVILNLWVFWP